MSTGQDCRFSDAMLETVEQDANERFVTYFGSTFDDKNRRISCNGRLQWKLTDGISKTRRFVRVSALSPTIQIVPFNNSISTLHRAVVERVFTVKDRNNPEQFALPPKPEGDTFSQNMQVFWDDLVCRLPRSAPVSHEQFVGSYTGRKRLRYARALTELREGWTSAKKESEISVFVKYEKTDVTSKKDPVPRVISPRSPLFNIRVGRYLKHLEKPLFRSIAKTFGETVILKGMNAYEVAHELRQKWDHFVDPVAVGLDASRFDQHVSKKALEWEHQVYLKCFPRKKDRINLGELLRYQLVNRCRGASEDGYLSYHVEGTRMSGDMNTSMGNCLLMCGMIYSYSVSCGVNLRLANNGDDCVVFMERRDLQQFMNGLDEWFTSMGFTMAVEEPCYVFEQIEFCQTKPINVENGWIMCRNPRTALAKDTTMLDIFTKKIFLGWLNSVGVGGLRMAGGLPIFNELYACYVRSGKRCRVPESLLPWSFTNMCKGMKRGYSPVSPETRASFWQAFGITPDEQLAIESEIRKVRIIPVLGDLTFSTLMDGVMN